MKEINKIVCSIDLADEHSREVGEFAASLAHAFDSEIILLYVVPQFKSIFDDMAQQVNDINIALSKLREGLWKKLEHFATEVLGGMRVSGRLMDGDVAQEILDTALQEDADLIVMGTRGRNNDKPMFYGSVAEKVTKHSLIPVLVIPPEQ